MNYVIRELIDSEKLKELIPHFEKVGLNWYDNTSDVIDNPFDKYGDLTEIRLIVNTKEYSISYSENKCLSYIKRILTMISEEYDIVIVGIDDVKAMIDSGAITKNK